MLNPNMGVLLITHYQRLLNYITPDYVHVLAAGRIVTSGGKDLALRLEEEGYGPILRENGLEIDRPRRGARACPQEPAGRGGRRRRRDERPMTTIRGPRPTAAPSSARPTRSTPSGCAHDFPILDQEINGHPLVYLDSASTLAEAAGRARGDRRPTTASTTRTSTAGSTRSARGRPRRTRRRGRRSPGSSASPDPHEIVFTRNATEAINLVAYSWGRKHIGRGDVIVLTEMEHHANLVPWQLLAQEKDADLEFIPITDDGILRQDVFDVLLKLKPKLVAFTHVSNTLGTINPVEDMTRRAHEAGALVLIDGAQAVPHLPVDVAAIGCRLLRVQRPQDARARRARARCGAAGRCSRRCRRSSAAAR